MDSTAKKALDKLLTQAEKAAGRPADESEVQERSRAIRLRLSESSFPEYLLLPTFADKESCNGAFRLAERGGAIRIQWDARAGENASIELIELIDANRLAEFLGTTPRWDIVADAEIAFRPHFARFPVLLHLLDAWRKGRSVRSSKASPDAIGRWLDAIAVVLYAEKNVAEGWADISLRRASTQLFDESKRIESITHFVDTLVQGTIDGVAREAEEVCQELGLVKYPSTFLVGSAISGDCSVVISLSQGDLLLIPPYLGFSPLELRHLTVKSAKTMVITVENLTTFHEAVALLRDEVPDSVVLVLYTGGMPSPSWRRAYRAVLHSVPLASLVFHWGDVDAGGFRIADKLASDCTAMGRSLRLHLMDIKPPSVRKSLSDREIRVITTICERWGWEAEATAVRAHKSAFEQEAVNVLVPLVS